MEKKDSESGGSPDSKQIDSPSKSSSNKADERVAGTSTRATARSSARKTPTKPAKMKDGTTSGATASETASQPGVPSDTKPQIESAWLKACEPVSPPAKLFTYFSLLPKRSKSKDAAETKGFSTLKSLLNAPIKYLHGNSDSHSTSKTAGPSTYPRASTSANPAASPSANPPASPSARTSASSTARTSASATASPTARTSATITASNIRSQSAGPTTRTKSVGTVCGSTLRTVAHTPPTHLYAAPPTISIDLPSPGSPPSNIGTPSPRTSASSSASPHVSPSGKSTDGNTGSPSTVLTTTSRSGSASSEPLQEFLSTPPRLTSSNATSPTVPFGMSSRRSSSLSPGTSASVPVSPSAAHSRISDASNLTGSLPASTSDITCPTFPTDSDSDPPEPMTNLNTTDLEKLLKTIYNNTGCWIPYARSMVRNLINILTIQRNLPLEWQVEFVAKVPDETWVDNGTLFVIMKYGGRYDVGIYTKDQHGLTTVYSGFLGTKRIRFSRMTILKDIHESIYPTVMDAIHEKKLTIKSQKKNFIYKMDKDKAIKLKIKIPDTLEVKTIHDSQAGMVNATWSDNYAQSKRYIEALVRMNGGYVLIRKNEGNHLSWILKSVLGQIGLVETVADSRRKGYGALLVKCLAKQIAQEDNHPVAIVFEENRDAQKFFEKIGFHKVGECYDIEVNDPSEVQLEDAQT